MPTPAETALTEGFAALDAELGKPGSFGAASLVGRVRDLSPDDPRLQGSADRLVEVRISPANAPAQLPQRGQEFTLGGITYRVSKRPYTDPATGETVILVVEA